jgi:hypothetical protein
LYQSVRCANWSNDAPNQRPWGDNVAEHYGVRTVDAYERHMTDPRTWGGHIELAAAAVPFGGVHVHQADGRADQRTGDAKSHRLCWTGCKAKTLRCCAACCAWTMCGA